MAQDRPYDDGNRDDRPERHLPVGRPDADADGSRTELAEPRTRTEYYEARRAADELDLLLREDPHEHLRAEAEEDRAERELLVEPGAERHHEPGEGAGVGHRARGRAEAPIKSDKPNSCACRHVGI